MIKIKYFFDNTKMRHLDIHKYVCLLCLLGEWSKRRVHSVHQHLNLKHFLWLIKNKIKALLLIFILTLSE